MGKKEREAHKQDNDWRLKDTGTFHITSRLVSAGGVGYPGLGTLGISKKVYELG